MEVMYIRSAGGFSFYVRVHRINSDKIPVLGRLHFGKEMCRFRVVSLQRLCLSPPLPTKYPPVVPIEYGCKYVVFQKFIIFLCACICPPAFFPAFLFSPLYLLKCLSRETGADVQPFNNK